jgi:hypothetical protein
VAKGSKGAKGTKLASAKESKSSSKKQVASKGDKKGDIKVAKK